MNYLYNPCIRLTALQVVSRQFVFVWQRYKWFPDNLYSFGSFTSGFQTIIFVWERYKWFPDNLYSFGSVTSGFQTICIRLGALQVASRQFVVVWQRYKWFPDNLYPFGSVTSDFQTICIRLAALHVMFALIVFSSNNEHIACAKTTDFIINLDVFVKSYVRLCLLGSS